MHVISWIVCSFILPGLSWINCVFVRRPTHKNTVARNSLDLVLLGQNCHVQLWQLWRCIFGIELEEWMYKWEHALGCTTKRFGCGEMFKKTSEPYEPRQYLAISPALLTYSIYLSPLVYKHVWGLFEFDFQVDVSSFLPLTTKPQSSWWSSMNFPDCRRTCTLWENIFPR